MFWNTKDAESISGRVAIFLVKGGCRLLSRIGIKRRNSPSAKKARIRILIVDLAPVCSLCSVLIDAGYPKTGRKMDILDLDDPGVIEAHVLFVCAKGAGGTLFANKGIGLAAALKQIYPKKKIVLYGFEGTVNEYFNAAMDFDGYIPYNAQWYEFLRMLKKFEEEINGRVIYM
jgi:hypothetical protein